MSFGLHCMFQETFLMFVFRRVVHTASRAKQVAPRSFVVGQTIRVMHSMYIYLCVLFDRNAAACMSCCLAVVVCLVIICLSHIFDSSCLIVHTSKFNFL